MSTPDHYAILIQLTEAHSKYACISLANLKHKRHQYTQTIQVC